jgi:hypothetical protein
MIAIFLNFDLLFSIYVFQMHATNLIKINVSNCSLSDDS